MPFCNHQTTLRVISRSVPVMLFHISFHHQTTTSGTASLLPICCLLSHFIIKPQLICKDQSAFWVAFYLISSSNHNLDADSPHSSVVAFYLISSSNHNPRSFIIISVMVAFYLISSSNHNGTWFEACRDLVAFYLISSSNHNVLL